MKIYFGAAITFSREMLPVYEKVVAQIEEMGHDVISKQVIDPELSKEDILNKQQPEKVFAAEIKKIKAADLMVAEVTIPSWGTAFLMEQALMINKPVIALYYKNAQRRLPLMIQGHPKLFVEHYSEENLKSVLKHFFGYLKKQRQRKGKFIVVDGTDGSGKATQSKLLVEKLRKLGKKVAHIEFPRYYSSFHGEVVGRFLRGEFGEINQVSPYLVSLAYALDRLTARKQIQDWLEAGYYVIADRYVSASLAHQAARVAQNERKRFIQWLEEMEYQQHKIPREDIVLFLYVPVAISQKLMARKGRRKYNAGKSKDIAEASLVHQKKALAVYLQLAKEKKHWVKVDCVDENNKLLSKAQVQEKVMEVLYKEKIL